jgi:hypothetical protein
MGTVNSNINRISFACYLVYFAPTFQKIDTWAAVAQIQSNADDVRNINLQGPTIMLPGSGTVDVNLSCFPSGPFPPNGALNFFNTQISAFPISSSVQQ